jgi:hypothetical protein
MAHVKQADYAWHIVGTGKMLIFQQFKDSVILNLIVLSVVIL